VSEARRPPHVTALTRPFWEAATRRELVRPVCDACGGSFFSPQVACPTCHSENWRYQPSTGRGVVHSYTVVHRAPSPGFDPPYVVADVDVEEGWHLMTNIVGCDVGDVHIGQRVAVSWLEIAPDVVLPTFAPIPEEST
jgi:uncharacterized protein